MRLPRILITAASSGSGKTTITCGLMRALKRRGLKVAAFKCGPDYIDPMFHRNVLGIASKNLDSFLAKEDVLRNLFAQSAQNADISVIEGVMGYYDGAGFDTTKASTYEVGKIISAPAILVINAKGMSLSSVAIIKGFLELEENSGIKAVILNRVTKMTYLNLKPVIEKKLGIKVVGFMPNTEECQLKSRHLGLIMPDELSDIQKQIDKIADLTEENINIEEIIRIANEADDFEIDGKWDELNDFSREESVCSNPVKIAVAYDKAFCFYYEDNFNLLKKLGVKLEFFSPIEDKKLPEGCSGLILGGGYPEIYAKELSENKEIKTHIRQAIENKMPCIAECGGFLYLHREIEDLEHNVYEMVGIIDKKAVYTGKLSRFGYVDVILNSEQMYGKKGDCCQGHEFHYYDSEENGSDALAVKPSGKRSWKCIHGNEFFEAGFPHLFYYSNIEFAKHFVESCRKYLNKTVVKL